jgi:hypothetical protein
MLAFPIAKENGDRFCSILDKKEKKGAANCSVRPIVFAGL